MNCKVLLKFDSVLTVLAYNSLKKIEFRKLRNILIVKRKRKSKIKKCKW